MSKALKLAAITVAAGVITTVVLNKVSPIAQEEEGFDEPIAAEKVFQGVVDPSAAQLINTSPSTEGASEGNVPQPHKEKKANRSSCFGGNGNTSPSTEGASDGNVPQPHEEEIANRSPCFGGKGNTSPAEEGVSRINNAQRSKVNITGGSCSHDRASAPLDQPIVVGSALAEDSFPEDSLPEESAPAPIVETREEPQVIVTEKSSPESSSAPAKTNSLDDSQPSAQAARSSKPAPRPAPKPAPRAAVLPDVPPPETQQVWWPAPLENELNLSYAGAASFTTAIALLFDGEFDNADLVNQHVAVNTANGDAVDGRWLVAKNNPKMLLYGVEPGIYRVRVGAGIADKDGRIMNRSFGGSLFIR